MGARRRRRNALGRYARLVNAWHPVGITIDQGNKHGVSRQIEIALNSDLAQFINIQLWIAFYYARIYNGHGALEKSSDIEVDRTF